MKSKGLTLQLAALRRGFAILGRLAQERRGCTFLALRQATGGVSAASLSRLLKVMRAEGIVAHDEQRGIYTLGPRFLELARTATGTRLPAEIVSPILERLAQETGESAAWFEVGDGQPFLAAKCEVADGFHYIAIGQRMHRVLPHGFGMVIAACAGDAFIARHMPLPLSRMKYRDLLGQIRKGRLIVRDLQSERKTTRVVAPVFGGANGPVLGAIGVSMTGSTPVGEHRRRLEIAVRNAAAEATAKLGEMPLASYA